jgi:hypothetical protein
MDRFVNDRNLECYRKLACATTTTAEREILFASLAEENFEFFRPRNARQDDRRRIALRVADLNARRAVSTTVLHECGHLLAATSLGFATGGIHLSATEAGASIDLLLSLRTIDEVLEFIERRVQVLYAGSLAESLVQKKVQDDVANRLLVSTAANDFAKARELVRMWVGLKYPEVAESTFQEKLTQVNERLYGKAAKLVEDNAGLIDDLAVFVMREWNAAVKPLGIGPQAFRISKEKIDAFLALKQCKSQHRADQSGLQSRVADASADVGRTALPPGIGGGGVPEPTRPTRGFEPHHLQAMLGAFDAVCARLRLPTHEGGRGRKRVASTIFDLAMTGETDEKRLVAKVLVEFGLGQRRGEPPSGEDQSMIFRRSPPPRERRILSSAGSQPR